MRCQRYVSIRSCVRKYEHACTAGTGAVFTCLFFVSYILIVGVVLMNIVIAVLLGPRV